MVVCSRRCNLSLLFRAKIGRATTLSLKRALKMLLPTIIERLAAHMKEKYKHIPDAIHVHDLVRCSHKKVMEERYPELWEDVYEIPAVQLGELVHIGLGMLPKLDKIEPVLEKTVDEYRIVGRPDVVTPQAVYDFKTIRKLPMDVLSHHRLAAEIYAWLAERPAYVIYFNPMGFKEFGPIDPIPEKEVKRLIEEPKIPRWPEWECDYCIFNTVCEYRIVR